MNKSIVRAIARDAQARRNPYTWALAQMLYRAIYTQSQKPTGSTGKAPAAEEVA